MKVMIELEVKSIVESSFRRKSNENDRVLNSFRLETHKDFMLCNFNAVKQLDMKNVDIFVQTNVLGYLKNNMKEQHDFMDSTGKPRIVIEQATFRKNLDFDKPETNYYKVGLNHFTYDEGKFYNKNSPSDRWEKIKERTKYRN